MEKSVLAFVKRSLLEAFLKEPCHKCIAKYKFSIHVIMTYRILFQIEKLVQTRPK